RTGVISPNLSSLASRSASRRSVLTRSAAAPIRDGAATTQLIPAPAHPRASPYPVGPASYTTRTGAGSVSSHATVASYPGGTRSDRASPLPPSITPATTEPACTSRRRALHTVWPSGALDGRRRAMSSYAAPLALSQTAVSDRVAGARGGGLLGGRSGHRLRRGMGSSSTRALRAHSRALG